MSISRHHEGAVRLGESGGHAFAFLPPLRLPEGPQIPPASESSRSAKRSFHYSSVRVFHDRIRVFPNTRVAPQLRYFTCVTSGSFLRGLPEIWGGCAMHKTKPSLARFGVWIHRGAAHHLNAHDFNSSESTAHLPAIHPGDPNVRLFRLGEVRVVSPA